MPVRTARGAEETYERIKSMAITFAIRPDARVNEVELARALNVSRTPLREALNRLMMEGFLVRAPNKGFIGRALDAKQIFDLYELRQALETNIIRIACERATDHELAELEDFVKASIDRRDRENAASLLALDEQFHERETGSTWMNLLLHKLPPKQNSHLPRHLGQRCWRLEVRSPGERPQI